MLGVCYNVFNIFWLSKVQERTDSSDQYFEITSPNLLRYNHEKSDKIKQFYSSLHEFSVKVNLSHWDFVGGKKGSQDYHLCTEK